MFTWYEKWYNFNELNNKTPSGTRMFIWLTQTVLNNGYGEYITPILCLLDIHENDTNFNGIKMCFLSKRLKFETKTHSNPL